MEAGLFVNNISLTSFRNLNSCQLQFDEKVNVLYGKNGSGKTNILEAIFVLLLGRSPRGAADQVMLKETADFYRIEGGIDIENKRYEFAIAYQKGGRKRITIDKVTSRAGDLFEKCAAVSAAPEDVELLAGPPAKRREFINIYLSQASGRHIADMSDYQKALSQKNAFLKQENNRSDTPYDDLLIKYGSIIMQARNNFLKTISEIAAEYYRKIAGGQKLMVNYKPSVSFDLGENKIGVIEKAFKEKLNRYKEKEKVLQMSLVGPHRDDIELYIGDFPARTHGSQGELRTAAISLKMAVFDYLKKIRRESPILLLDEIFAELDDDRKEILVELFGQFGQLFLTSASQIPKKLLQTSRAFKIENGTVVTQ
jgi:DNA replication and repair protein RecF